jgi:hypothetical protein
VLNLNLYRLFIVLVYFTNAFLSHYYDILWNCKFCLRTIYGLLINCVALSIFFLFLYLFLSFLSSLRLLQAVDRYSIAIMLTRKLYNCKAMQIVNANRTRGPMLITMQSACNGFYEGRIKWLERFIGYLNDSSAERGESRESAEGTLKSHRLKIVGAL